MRAALRIVGVALAWAVAAGAGAPRVEDLAFMSGDWELTSEAARTEEHWTLPAGGTLLGSGRTIAGGKTVFFEFLRIETREDGIFYVGQPKGRPGTDFKLVRLEEGSVVFENLSHDFPKRILYRREPGGGLHARVEGDGTESEKPQDYRYKPSHAPRRNG